MSNADQKLYSMISCDIIIMHIQPRWKQAYFIKKLKRKIQNREGTYKRMQGIRDNPSKQKRKTKTKRS